MIAPLVYILCAATALACAILLGRGYARRRTALLFWSTACFAGLTLSNTLLVIDLLVVPNTDLSLYRNLITWASGAMLLYSFVTETTS